MVEKKIGELELNRIYNMDCLEGMKQIEDNSVDLIVTDPPYGVNKKDVFNDESLDVYYRSLPELYRVLKNNSWFICFTSIKRLPEMFRNNPFTYRSLGFIYYNNMNRLVPSVMGYNKYTVYIVFAKGNPKINKKINDVQVHTYKKKTNFYFGGGKPLQPILNIINCFAKINYVVLDCFVGSGTFVVACKLKGIKYIGFEIDKEMYDISTIRLKKVQQQMVLVG